MLFPNFRRGRQRSDDIEINYVTAGKGPPLLLLHGFPQNLAMWARVTPILAADFTVVCGDLRGYGDSSKPKCEPDRSNYSFRAMARGQAGLMNALGFDRFHVVGHDRGGRTAHRMALDHPEVVLSLAVLDIVPTYAMFMETNRHVAGAYWHWYFLSRPEPFPERLIASDPDFFYETCLVGWGATKLADFDAVELAQCRARVVAAVAVEGHAAGVDGMAGFEGLDPLRQLGNGHRFLARLGCRLGEAGLELVA